jgi:hypothetical protein
MNLWRFGVQLGSFPYTFARINALVFSAFLHELVVYPLENHNAKEGILIVRSDRAICGAQ